MKFAIPLAALGLAAIAVPAHAQDPAQISKVSVGVVAGIDSVTLKIPADGSYSDTNIAYGVSLAYDHGIGDVFFGIEGEATESEVNGTYDIGVEHEALNATRDLYLGTRLGVYVGDTLSLYVKGGYTNAGAEYEYSNGTTSYDENVNMDGFRIGGGMEANLSSNLAVRVEYRYSDYGEFSYANVTTGITAERHQGMIGLLGRF